MTAAEAERLGLVQRVVPRARRGEEAMALGVGMAMVVPLALRVCEAGLNQSLYSACNAWLGHRRGGLALATIGACGAFAAICGSSLATAATMAQIALPEMRKYKYDDRLATGAVAAGGTIGILIPPSVVMVPASPS